MDPVTLIALAGLAITLISGTGAQVLGGISSGIRGRLLNYAKEIQRRIQNNNSLKEKFLTAYQEKNARKLNALFTGIGFGARAAGLEKELAADKQEMLEVIEKVNGLNIQYDQLLTQANSAIQNAGTITGNMQAEEAENEIQKGLVNTPQLKNDDLSQNINGGTE